jgi:transposase
MISVGVDTHRDSLSACALDERGALLSQRRFANRPAGHRAAAAWLARLGGERRVGIEGAGGLGRALSQHLLACGETVLEVPALRTRRERRHLGSPGKSDAGDAQAIARVVAAGLSLPSLRPEAASDELKTLCDYRDELIAERTRLLNRLSAELACRLPGPRPPLRTASGLRAARAALRGSRGAWAQTCRARLRRVGAIERECATLEAQIAERLGEQGLTAICGIGTLTAARLLAETAGVERFRSAAAFAMAAGVAPIPASSGRVQRHRLNRGGNRQLNHALHTVALVQARHHPPARAYLDRKRSEGLSGREAIRCLKRHLANVVYRQMLRDALTT